MPAVSAVQRRARRRFLAGATGLLVLPGHLVRADETPTPITFLIPAPAGASTDRLGRIVADGLAAILGTEVLVDNIPGDSGVTGTNAIVTAAADGTVVGLAISSAIIGGKLLSRNAKFNPVDAFQWFAIFGTFPTAMIIPAQSPHRSAAEWLAAARQSPVPLVFASAGTGSAGHFAGAYLRLEQGANLVHRSLDSLNDGYALLGSGAIDTLFVGVPSALIEAPKSGHRIVAVTSATRVDVLPAVPSFGELWRQSFVAWIGLVAPKRIDGPTYSRLTSAVSVLLADPLYTDRMRATGMTFLGLNGRAALTFLEEEFLRNAKLLSTLNQEGRRI